MKGWWHSDRVIRWRARSTPVDVAVETIAGYQRHQTTRNVAVLTYYGFLSIFPLFMVATSVLGFVLQGNEQLQQDILDTAAAQIPVIGTAIEEQAGALEGSVWSVVIGLMITLWAATRAFVGVQTAFDDAWDVPVLGRPNMAVRRGHALVGIAIIGTSLVGATALSTFASLANLPFGGRLLLLLGTITINVTVLTAMFRYLTAASVTWRDAWRGAAVGGVGFTVLQVGGVTIVDRFLASASDTAGVFATVFALMAWINLHAHLSLFGVELNAALRRRERRNEEASLWLHQGLSVPDPDEIG